MYEVRWYQTYHSQAIGEKYSVQKFHSKIQLTVWTGDAFTDHMELDKVNLVREQRLVIKYSANEKLTGFKKLLVNTFELYEWKLISVWDALPTMGR